jgi:peptidoglycan/xylan/chitin deacetylase (PgdA/CDA1 family)
MSPSRRQVASGSTMIRPAILMYHAVDTKPDPLFVQVTPGRLRQQLQMLHRLGLHGVAVRELRERRSRRARVVGLTFDDGYADFATTAVPILAEFGFSATVFMVAGQVGGGNDWDPPPHRPLMTAEQLRAVHEAGHEIGSHGMRHVRLPGLPREALEEELGASRAALERIVQSPVAGFCYPYGELNPETVAAVRDTYDYACAVKSPPQVSDWSLPRFHVGEVDGPLRFTAKLSLRPVRERLQRRTP